MVRVRVRVRVRSGDTGRTLLVTLVMTLAMTLVMTLVTPLAIRLATLHWLGLDQGIMDRSMLANQSMTITQQSGDVGRIHARHAALDSVSVFNGL